MGNCDRHDFNEDEDDENKDRNFEQSAQLRIKFEFKDPLISEIKRIVPSDLLICDEKHFSLTYRIKKNLKCEKNIIYKIKVAENKESGRLLNCKCITRNNIKAIGDEAFLKLLAAEIKALSIIKHSNVESLVSVYLNEAKENFKLCLVTNHSTKSSLLDLINEHIAMQRRFENKEIATIMKILIETVYFFKTKYLIHRNLSPENIFFLKENAYFTLNIRNFYFSTLLEKNQNTNGIVGGLWYMAPEMIRDLKYDYKVDIWSLGIILYMLLTLDNPFTKATSRDSMIEVLKLKEAFRQTKDLKKLGIDSNALYLFEKMTTEEPNLRTPAELLIEDSFFKANFEMLEENYIRFNKYIAESQHAVGLQAKIQARPHVHKMIFYIILSLKDYFMDADDLIYLGEFYHFFDTNRDGTVTTQEMEEVIKKDPKMNNDETKQYISLIKDCANVDIIKTFADITTPNSIDSEIFICANIIFSLFVPKNISIVKRRIHIIFNQMDKNRDKQISLKEVQKFFKRNNTKYDINVDEEWRAVLDKKDNDEILVNEEDLTNLILYRDNKSENMKPQEII